MNQDINFEHQITHYGTFCILKSYDWVWCSKYDGSDFMEHSIYML